MKWVSESCICILLIIQLFGSITTVMMLPSYFDFVVDIYFVSHLMEFNSWNPLIQGGIKIKSIGVLRRPSHLEKEK